MIELKEEFCCVSWVCNIKHADWNQVTKEQADICWDDDSHKRKMQNHLQHSQHNQHEYHSVVQLQTNQKQENKQKFEDQLKESRPLIKSLSQAVDR